MQSSTAVWRQTLPGRDTWIQSFAELPRTLNISCRHLYRVKVFLAMWPFEISFHWRILVLCGLLVEYSHFGTLLSCTDHLIQALYNLVLSGPTHRTHLCCICNNWECLSFLIPQLNKIWLMVDCKDNCLNYLVTFSRLQNMNRAEALTEHIIQSLAAQLLAIRCIFFFYVPFSKMIHKWVVSSAVMVGSVMAPSYFFPTHLYFFISLPFTAAEC